MENQRDKARVTVLVPAYNREQYLAQALESVLRQTETEWRCIIVDDCSTDGTRAVAETFATLDTRFEVISLPENRGLGMALNAGLDHVTTPYFVILDSDDWLSDDAIEQCLKVIDSQGQSVSLVCGNGVNWSEHADGTLHRGVTQRGQAFTDQYEFFRFGPNLVPRFMRTSTVLSVGGFEDDPLTHGRHFEDKLLLLKLIHISDFAYVDADLYHIRQHATNMTKPETREKFIEIKRYFYERTLVEWGDEYEVEWFLHPEGWLDVRNLHAKTRG